MSEEEAEDDGVNRACSLLYVLKEVAISSSVCEKKAIAALFHDHRESFLDQELVKKVSLFIRSKMPRSGNERIMRSAFGFMQVRELLKFKTQVL